MCNIRLYVDDSEDSKQIEEELRRRQIRYFRIEEERSSSLPALSTDSELIHGPNAIRMYLSDGETGFD